MDRVAASAACAGFEGRVVSLVDAVKPALDDTGQDSLTKNGQADTVGAEGSPRFRRCLCLASRCLPVCEPASRRVQRTCFPKKVHLDVSAAISLRDASCS